MDFNIILWTTTDTKFIAKSPGSVWHVPEVKGCFGGREASCQSRKSQQDSTEQTALSTEKNMGGKINLHLRLLSQHAEIELLTVMVFIYECAMYFTRNVRKQQRLN